MSHKFNVSVQKNEVGQNVIRANTWSYNDEGQMFSGTFSDLTLPEAEVLRRLLGNAILELEQSVKENA